MSIKHILSGLLKLGPGFVLHILSYVQPRCMVKFAKLLSYLRVPKETASRGM